MELIITIVIFVVIKLMKQDKNEVTQMKNILWDKVQKSSNQNFADLHVSAATNWQAKAKENIAATDWQKKAKENIAKAAARAKQKSQRMGKDTLGKARNTTGQSANRQVNYTMPKRTVRTTPAQVQLNRNQTPASQMNNVELTANQKIRKRQLENKNMSILQCAKENVTEDMVSGNVLGTISDLMIKGYEGNLCFERDFVGEAMEMIGRFQPPTEVPDYSMPQMKF